MDNDGSYRKVTEGRATLLYPETEEVFYNPIQQFNRDISVLGIKAWTSIYRQTKKRKRDETGNDEPFINIIEGLAASGLRSCRYAKEIPLIKKVVANDLSPSAVEAIKRNAKYNEVQDIVEAHQGDANAVMWLHKQTPVHVVDLDPYGTAAPFIDAALQAVTNNGIMLVTCTDLAVLAGNSYPEKCFSLYGGTTVRNDATHESALRLLLNLVATTAARYGKTIEPLLSLSIDYYVRCFIQVKKSPVAVKQNIGKSSTVYTCTGCKTTHIQPLGSVKEQNGNFKFGYAKGPVVGTTCEFCESPLHIAGPLWTGPLHSKEYVSKMLELVELLDQNIYPTAPRIKGMLTLVNQEIETPFYVSPSNMSSIVRAPVPPLQKFVSAIYNGGYKASLTHAKAGCIKTDAPYSFLWDTVKAWAKETGTGKPNPDAPGAKIMSQPPQHEISFEINASAEHIETLRKSKLVRFPMNPRPEWGPMSKPNNKKKASSNEIEL
ncbi:tRNA (guanine(26)-N(2))-dimethyltransferase, mitochondrial [Wickerhamiella sorbophila]|uniref:tRNA (guanine(26)-N(2))-dimethyltransferase n=1 Tax=Wickerhamiella sorbophila TaxID=45607 RepID=A0A2T0FMH6_9ASCO|nr:tRNA (guanine(26)-N(2))-dimethyltransferase, mitochondrial [Wickerhamiella sorbophila]PRT56177.1 tRNA (guanine(26)-N(2))-dimethyltransferase, mitochondrial [Wickerhamiella sorbophila]